jgi:hypothetical protein
VQILAVEVGGVNVEPGGLVVLPPTASQPPVRVVLEAQGVRAGVEIAGTAKVVFMNGW